MIAHGRLKTVLFIAALLLPAIDAVEQAATLRPYGFPKPAEARVGRPLRLGNGRRRVDARGACQCRGRDKEDREVTLRSDNTARRSGSVPDCYCAIFSTCPAEYAETKKRYSTS